MKALLLKTTTSPSKYGGVFHYLFFKGEDGKSYRSCISPKMGNFARWNKFIDKQNVWIDNLNLKGNLIDADSFPKEIINEAI